jgi:hypothetical protein
MAFGNFPEDIKNTIDYSHCTPISVIAAFNPEGKIMPAYVSLVDLYGNVCKTKIDSVKQTKDGNGYTTYCCLYCNGFRQQQANLTFHVKEHLWVLEN